MSGHHTPLGLAPWGKVLPATLGMCVASYVVFYAVYPGGMNIFKGEDRTSSALPSIFGKGEQALLLAHALMAVALPAALLGETPHTISDKRFHDKEEALKDTWPRQVREALARARRWLTTTRLSKEMRELLSAAFFTCFGLRTLTGLICDGSVALGPLLMCRVGVFGPPPAGVSQYCPPQSYEVTGACTTCWPNTVELWRVDAAAVFRAMENSAFVCGRPRRGWWLW